MYSPYLNINIKIRKTITDLKLTDVKENYEELMADKKRFYRTICFDEKKNKVFFKTLLAKEKGIKNRFLNEILFLATLNKLKNHPLHNRVPKILKFSTQFSFPFLLYKFEPGKSRLSKDKFSTKEIPQVVNLLKAINSSPFENFKFLSPKNYLNLKFSEKQIKNLLKDLFLEKKIKTEIKKLINKNQKILYNTKSALTHGDFSEANIVFTKKSLKIIDWEHVSLRNPLYDLAEFWIKRKKYQNEQKYLITKYLKNYKGKETFWPIFKLALLEICLRDLNLFQKVLREEKKSEKISRKFKKEIKNYLKILKENVLK